VVRKELDLNWDGKVDISRTYDEREQIVQEASTWTSTARSTRSTTTKGRHRPQGANMLSTGKPTSWLFYEKGKLVRKEKDTNNDGKVDYWEYWEGDQVRSSGEDLDGDGTSTSGPRTQ